MSRRAAAVAALAAAAVIGTAAPAAAQHPVPDGTRFHWRTWSAVTHGEARLLARTSPRPAAYWMTCSVAPSGRRLACIDGTTWTLS